VIVEIWVLAGFLGQIRAEIVKPDNYKSREALYEYPE
jgi:hypothetical protein